MLIYIDIKQRLRQIPSGSVYSLSVKKAIIFTINFIERV